MKKEQITIKINGKECIGHTGQTVLQIAEENNILIPNLCYNKSLKHYGGCSLCVIEAAGSPKLLRACSTVPAEGQEFYTETERVVRTRRISMELLMSDHVGDCRGPCVTGCPNNVNVQDYIQAIARGDDLEAVKIIKEHLPFPSSIGRVCPHPCETECRRKMVEEPISICYLKAFAADRVRADGGYIPVAAKKTGKKVGIIGGGPGGLTAAHFLALSGNEVTIVDAQDKLGGMLRYGIPEYRLPKKILDEEIQEILSLGIKVKTGFKIGKDVALQDFAKDFDATILAIGAWTSMGIGCKGDELDGVLSGISFLGDVARGNAPEIGDSVAIVGGGNTAMDACRTAVRLGAKNVYVIYRRTEAEMPAEEIEIKEAKEEGVIFKFLTNPSEIIGENGKVKEIKLQIMELGEADESGRRRPVPVEGKFEILPVDTVIAAIGQKVDTLDIPEITLNKRGIIEADPGNFKTNIENVYAIGDATNRGASIAIEAIAEGRRCAAVVDLFLKGIDVPYKRTFRSIRHDFTADMLPKLEKEARITMPTRPANERNKDFVEVNLGFDEDKARKEANRCMDCGCFDYHECRLIECANLYEINPDRLGGDTHTPYKEQELLSIERDQGKCILCGQCVRTCSEVVGKGIIDLVDRGFDTAIKPEYRSKQVVDFCGSCLECAKTCPTGALKILK